MEYLRFRCVQLDVPLIRPIHKIAPIYLKFIQIILAFNGGKYF